MMHEITIDAHEFATAVIDYVNTIHKAARYEQWSKTHHPNPLTFEAPKLYKLMQSCDTSTSPATT